MPSASRVRFAKLRVGVTAAVALLILGVFLALLTGGRLFKQRDVLLTYMPDASGFAPGSPVRLNGIPVGKVDSVRFSGSKDLNRVVVLVMQVEHRYLAQIPQDSKATITAENIQGEMYLDITRGASPATIRPGAEIAFQPAPDVLKRIDLAEFESRMRKIDALLAGIEEGKGRVGQLVKGDQLYRDTLKRIAELESAVHRATDPKGGFGTLLYSDEDFQKLSAPLRRIDDSLARIRQNEMLRDTGRYEQIRTRMADLRKTLEDARTAAFLGSDEMYSAWLSGVASLARGVDDFNTRPALAAAQPYEALNGAMLELEKSLREFRTDPRKYMRLKLF